MIQKFIQTMRSYVFSVALGTYGSPNFVITSFKASLPFFLEVAVLLLSEVTHR